MQKETKEDLKNIIKNSAQTLDIPLQELEIKDSYRINTKSTIKPIIVNFTTVGTKEKFISAYK